MPLLTLKCGEETTADLLLSVGERNVLQELAGGTCQLLSSLTALLEVQTFFRGLREERVPQKFLLAAGTLKEVE